MKKTIFSIKSCLAPILVGLYLLLWLIDTNTGIRLQAIPGIFLFLYLPGFYLTKIAPVFNLSLGKFGRVGLRTFYSFSFISVAGYLTQSISGFNSKNQIWLILIVNLFLYILAFCLPRLKLWTKWRILGFQNKRIEIYEINKNDFLLIAIALALTIIPIILSPIVQNADGFFLLIKKSILFDQNVLNGRQFFVSFPNLTSRFLGIDLKFVFRNVFIFLYFISTLFLFDYQKLKIKNQFFIAIGYLALFIPPVILTEVNIIRPQVAMIAFTLPILILSIFSIQRKDILPAMIAAGFSLVSLKYHELSIALLIVAFLAILFSLWRLTFVEKKIGWKHIAIAVLIVYPYWNLYNLGGLFKNAIVLMKLASTGWNHLGWRWWFLSSYKSVDGINLGWQGIQAVEYYLYNGLLLLLVIVAFYILLRQFNKRLGAGTIVPAVYLLIFFFFAEVMPRFGLYFLPSRAWVHLMLATVVILTIELEKTSEVKINPKKLFMAFGALTLIGFCGTVYVAKNNLNTIFPEELKAANFIKKSLPNSAVILSSQDNQNLVMIYGERNYGQINLSRKTDRRQFDQTTSEKLAFFSKDQGIVTRPLIVQITQTLIKGVVTEEEKNILQTEKIEVNKAIYSENDPVYFLYSYKKLSGFNGSRDYQKNTVDEINKDTYAILGYPIVYSDDNTILLKLK